MTIEHLPFKFSNDPKNSSSSSMNMDRERERKSNICWEQIRTECLFRLIYHVHLLEFIEYWCR